MRDLPLGRIDVVPPHEHTASRKNPYDALAQEAYLDRCALNREAAPELHVPTQEEEDTAIVEWGTDRGSTRIAQNLLMLYSQTKRLDEDDIRDLAQAIKKYGDDCAEAAIERYQEQGE